MSRDKFRAERDLELTIELVSAYVSNNSVPISALPIFVSDVHASIKAQRTSALTKMLYRFDGEKPRPEQIRASVRHDGIVSFIDGKIYKTLKRHLTAKGFDPQSYRERYGLPADYPMVAPSYAERRSALAKSIGLGQAGAMAERSRKGRKAA